MTLRSILLAMYGEVAHIESMTGAEAMTADELLRLRMPDKRTELVRGQLMVREPAGGRHGFVAARLARRLGDHVDESGAGYVYAAETGFKIESDPDTVRAPDVGFVARDRLSDPLPAGFLPGAPDLAVEVLSHDDRPGEVLCKVGDWLNAGARLVWVIDAEKRTGKVYRADGSVALLSENDAVDGEDVLPGFRCPVAELFA